MIYLKDYVNFAYEIYVWSHLGEDIFNWEHVEVTWTFRTCEERDEASKMKKISPNGHLHTRSCLCLKDISELLGKGIQQQW